MAVLGHSGSQAPQLMHSLVITVAIGCLPRLPARPLGMNAQRDAHAPHPDKPLFPNGFRSGGQTRKRPQGVGSATRLRLRMSSMIPGRMERKTTTTITR